MVGPVPRRAFVIRKLHKWLGLVVGLQALVWLLSGAYMVLVDIDFIHGDPMVRNVQQVLSLPASGQLGMTAFRDRYPDATRIALKAVKGKAHYLVSIPGGQILIDPETGQVISPLGEEAALAIARFHFNGDAPVLQASLITSNPPMEIQARPLPLWRVDFDDRFSTSFYIDPNTGSLVTRRHRYWRIFDVMWMLHIMDYDERVDAHNPLLITAQVAGLALVVTGAWLLFYCFGRRGNNNGRKRQVNIT
jgi:uncharacterized iron-regulated membrane protein